MRKLLSLRHLSLFISFSFTALRHLSTVCLACTTISPSPLMPKSTLTLRPMHLLKQSNSIYFIITSRHQTFSEANRQQSAQVTAATSSTWHPPLSNTHSPAHITQITLFCRGTILSSVSLCGMCTLLKYPNPENVHPARPRLPPKQRNKRLGLG